MLHAAAIEVFTCQQYLNVTIKGKTYTGDAFSSDWKGGAVGARHAYDNVQVDRLFNSFHAFLDIYCNTTSDVKCVRPSTLLLDLR